MATMMTIRTRSLWTALYLQQLLGQGEELATTHRQPKHLAINDYEAEQQLFKAYIRSLRLKSSESMHGTPPMFVYRPEKWLSSDTDQGGRRVENSLSVSIRPP